MKPIIEIQNLSKRYSSQADSFDALSDINLTIYEGEIFGIMGQSGAGKSTLLRCLTTLELGSSGSVKLLDKNISSLSKQSLRALRSQIGMVFQHFQLLDSRTVEQNIALPLEIAGDPEIDSKVNKLLSLVGLSDKRNSYPSCLSGGEKQRVGIARALALSPKILFCDEATSALDPKTTKEILQLLLTLNQTLQITIVLITHQMEVIKQICHRAAVLEKGKIIELDSIAHLFTSPQHKTTKNFLQNTVHDLPEDFHKRSHPEMTLLRLSFLADSAKDPIITQLIRLFDIQINILQGWIDTVQGSIIGSLTVELSGSKENQEKAFNYLISKNIQYEVLSYAS